MTFEPKVQYTPQMLEFDTREISGGLAEPWDPGEAGEMGFVALQPPVALLGLF